MRALVLAAALCVAATPAFAQSAIATAAPAEQTVRLVVPVRAIARGEVLSAADLTYAQMPPARAFGGAVIDMHALEGKETRRFLEAGQPVRPSDVRAPILVSKGSTVTMTFTAPGIALTAVGKAVSEGGLGETVTVLNPVSFRQISAVVTGPGTVAAGPTAVTLTSAPARLAAVNP